MSFYLKGHIYGNILWVRDGEWRVNVGKYHGKEPGKGAIWTSIQLANHMRLDVLARQLQAVGLQMDVGFRRGTCVIVPTDRRENLRRDGIALRRLMVKNYGRIVNCNVHWKWDIRQYN